MNELPPLPTYPDEDLAALSPSRLTDILIENEDRVPRNVIDECARRGDTMVEKLSGLIESNRDWQGESPGEWWLKLHAVMILGLIPTERAGQLLVKFMRRMSREEDHDLQDWLAGYWPALFQNKPENVLPALRALGEDRAVDWYIRTGAIEAYVVAAQHRGNDALESALEWLAGIAANEQEDWNLRLCSGNTLLDFPRIQHRSLLEEMAARQGSFGVHFAQSDVTKAYIAMQDKADWDRFSDPWVFYSPAQIVSRTQRWAEEDARKNDTALDDAYDNDDAFLSEIFVRTEPKIGRNDPCPCGSGKKYKKCCLNVDETGGDIF
jgi:hypothetical protein